jgi:hypothetical protein
MSRLYLGGLRVSSRTKYVAGNLFRWQSQSGWVKERRKLARKRVNDSDQQQQSNISNGLASTEPA